MKDLELWELNQAPRRVWSFHGAVGREDISKYAYYIGAHSNYSENAVANTQTMTFLAMPTMAIAVNWSLTSLTKTTMSMAVT